MSASAEVGAGGGAEPGHEPSEAALAQFFGVGWERIRQFHGQLREHGVQRGLVGPREVDRLWTRHLLNSAAAAAFLPSTGSVADIGTGAGLPGIVLATMRPDLRFHLVEPMQRRVVWLDEVVSALGLTNVTVHAARAEELRGSLAVDAATARAVAALDKLVVWALPLLVRGGRLLALKGMRARDELAAARPVMRRAGVARVEVHEVDLLSLGDPTTVVEIWKA